MSKVLVMDSTYDTCSEAVEQAFQAFPVDVSGKKVAVKINALKACDPDQQALVTHYKLVQAVIKKLESLKPAQIVVGDSVGTESYGNSEYVFDTARLKEGSGPYYRNFNKNLAVVELDQPFKRNVAVLKDVLDADVYISVPKMKTHGLTRISGGMKNNYGLLTGAQKSWYHYYSGKAEVFARIVVEMFKVRKPDLVIMDAIMAMEGYGPASPEIRWVNKVLASNDAVALDTVQSKIIGFDVDDVPYLRIARELSLGETDLEKIEIVGDGTTIQEYHRPDPPAASYSYKAGVGSGTTSIDFYRQRVAYRPVIDKGICEKCFSCADNCPFSALTRGNDGPVLDPTKCMICSSCKEQCATGALKIVPDESILAELVQEEQKK